MTPSPRSSRAPRTHASHAAAPTEAAARHPVKVRATFVRLERPAGRTAERRIAVA
jgi:hypothetical protein